MIRFFLGARQYEVYWRMQGSRVRFSSLHGSHRHFNITIVAIDLFLKVFLAFFEMA